ncbi:MAG: COP23 domain-containing protein [Cyanobacteria bacterium P01_G01_bin.39]
MVTGATVCVNTLTIATSVNASGDKYFCQEVDDVHGIYSSTERGKIKYMNFVRDVSQGWSIERRCDVVADRFQRFDDSGVLKFVVAGYVNNEPVLCAVAAEGNLCSSDNVLVTLPPQSDPVREARRLIDTRGLAAGRVISVNGKQGKLESYVNGNTYYNLEILEQLILEDENSDRLIPNE